MGDTKTRLELWDDPDIDFERAKQDGENWKAAAATVSDESVRKSYEDAVRTFSKYNMD